MALAWLPYADAADSTADASGVAREMLAQAEHDPLACAIAVVANGAGPTALVMAGEGRSIDRR